MTGIRIGFWSLGIFLAVLQAWAFRFEATADSISYLDMSDAVLPGGNWHRLINGVWSPLYPLLLGIFRAVFKVSPANDIVAGHVLNVIFFLAAFACFEFFLQTAMKRIPANAEDVPAAASQRWTYLVLGYTLFIWASVGCISLWYLRADMLMSSFVYLAVALLLRMQGQVARWKDYATLGAILGLAILAKEVMLPIGLFTLLVAVFVAKDWRPAIKMSATATAVMFLIGCLYFVPLSIARGSFTLGESGAYNYLLFVNNVQPRWYLQNVGSARGSFVHTAEQIFSSPRAYAFAQESPVTHPLRFDPSEWTTGVRPRFMLRSQIKAMVPCLQVLYRLQAQLTPLILAILAAAFLAWRKGQLLQLRETWPVWVIGPAVCMLYLPVHVETRYVGEFIALFWFGIAFALRNVLPPGRKAVAILTALIAVLVLSPLALRDYRMHRHAKTTNADAQAAAELAKLGIGPGDKVARVSATVVDLGLDRIARVEIAAEVDRGHAREFWRASAETQRSLLKRFSDKGIKAVIANLDGITAGDRSGWLQLGSTYYWVWLPNKQN
jgi:hypothetical protein